MVHAPLAFTQSAFRFGNADWSLKCSTDSGGSWYIKLLDLRLLPCLVSPMFLSVLSADDLLMGAGLVLAAKDRVRGMIRGDSLAVLIVSGLVSIKVPG